MPSLNRERATDTALEALANQYRRQLLVALLDHNPQDDHDRDPLDILTEEEEPDVLQTDLVHWHLPHLAGKGYITWNRDTNEISKGPNWDEIAPLLEHIHDHRDELPDSWF